MIPVPIKSCDLSLVFSSNLSFFEKAMLYLRIGIKFKIECITIYTFGLHILTSIFQPRPTDYSFPLGIPMVTRREKLNHEVFVACCHFCESRAELG